MNEADRLAHRCLDIALELDKRGVDSKTVRLALKRLSLCNQVSKQSAILLYRMKKEKHTKAAQKILASPESEGDAFEKLFKSGDEKAISGYLKLGREGEVYLKEVEKSTHDSAILFEKIFSKLVDDFDQTRVDCWTGLQVVTETGEKEECIRIVFSFPDGSRHMLDTRTLKEVDFSSIQISSKSLEAYKEVVLQSQGLKYRPEASSKDSSVPSENFFHQREIDFGVDGRKISYPEKLAINVYTGRAYSLMNFFLKGDLKLVAQTANLSSGAAAKEAFLHCTVSMSALFKLEDYNQPGEKFLWRGEGLGFEKFGKLAQFKKAVDQGGIAIKSMGFLSAAYNRPHLAFYHNKSPAGVLIRNVSGKKVTPWSKYSDSQREVLLPPIYLKWEHYKEVQIGKRKVTFFIARPLKTVPSREKVKDLRIRAAKSQYETTTKKALEKKKELAKLMKNLAIKRAKTAKYGHTLFPASL